MSTPAESAVWAEASSGVAAALGAYFAEKGRDSESEAVRSTIRTNTELVPARAENLMLLLSELGGGATITGRRILEAGCGFGALASYLAWRWEPAELVAVDTRSEYVEAARRCTGALALGDRLRFVEADMRRLEGIEDRSVEILIVNNAFIYLAQPPEMRQALATFRRVLVPGGRLLMYHANRWAWQEPFTRDPVVHLLPPRLGAAVGTLTGWKHNHGRVRLVSPPGMTLLLRRSGFADVRLGGFEGGRVVTGAAAWLHRFYGVTARSPA